jgi:hypothetical protein
MRRSRLASEGRRESDAGPEGLFPGKPAPARWAIGHQRIN